MIVHWRGKLILGQRRGSRSLSLARVRPHPLLRLREGAEGAAKGRLRSPHCGEERPHPTDPDSERRRRPAALTRRGGCSEGWRGEGWRAIYPPKLPFEVSRIREMLFLLDSAKTTVQKSPDPIRAACQTAEFKQTHVAVRSILIGALHRRDVLFIILGEEFDKRKQTKRMRPSAAFMNSRPLSKATYPAKSPRLRSFQPALPHSPRRFRKAV